GKTIFDRIIAAGLVGTNGFIILILIGFLFERVNMFIDIAIAYALLNFVVVIVLGKYFDRGGERL
ncbi:MAG: pH regulation protein F, partial [Dehalococcoidia bacterium SG8_51_3]